MYTCELFSFRKSKADFDSLDLSFNRLRAGMKEQGYEIQYKTDLALDPRKISEALHMSLSSDSPDIFIFSNALYTSDSSSFKSAFYEFITTQEAMLSVDGEHENTTPKIKIFSLGNLGYGYKGYCFRIYEKIFIALPYASLVQEDIASFIPRAVAKAMDIIDENREAYPDGIAFKTNDTEQPVKEKEGFIRSFFPHKGDEKATKVRKVIVLIAIIAFLGALVYVVDYFIIAPWQNNSINAEIQELAYSSNTGETTADGDPVSEQDWDALKKVNKEIVGWIRIDNTKIDYPVLEHKGDDVTSQYYLKHTYKKDYSDYGSIFVDYRCPDSVNSKNVILHGHNMQDGSMFHELTNYTNELKGNLDYYKEHPVITFNTPDGDAKWKIISVFKTSTLYAHGEFFNYMQGEFNSDAEFMNFVYNMRIRSMFDIPVMVNEDDQILTLSTCTYDFTQWRLVVVARKMRAGEDENVDVQLATRNSSPLFPDVYYSRYGGTRPDPLTFKTANARGLVSWYDGKGDLNGSEDLTATIASNPTEPPTSKDGTTATQPSVITYYTVTYRNYDGSQYAAYTVQEGSAVPIPDGTPVMPEDDYYYYVFKEWNFNVDGVNFDALNTSLEIYPTFTPVAK